MNYKNLFVAFSLITAIFIPLTSFKPAVTAPPDQIKVMMVTNYGVIKLKLYNETPLHRDNFVKLVRAHYFDSLLFHRVIQKFMIQGGDPDSKNALPGAQLGEGGPKYTVPAEFSRNLFHKKGVLAAARESDLDNPTQASSGSQFYIVQGRTYTDSLLKTLEPRITKRMLFNYEINLPENQPLVEKYRKYAKEKNNDSIKYINDVFDQKVEKELPNVAKYKFTTEQIKAYSTIGGTPTLDNSYTVFGEVYEGLDIVDLIAAQKVDGNARPLEDIRIISATIIP